MRWAPNDSAGAIALLAPRAQRDGDWLIGQGVATGTYPVYRMATAARVRINADGTALVQTSCQEMGMGTATVQTQHAAERLGLPLENVRFEYGDSSLPWAGVAGGSSQTVSVALAVQQAADELVKAFLSLARQHADSPLAKASVKEVQAANERHLSAGTSRRPARPMRRFCSAPARRSSSAKSRPARRSRP